MAEPTSVTTEGLLLSLRQLSDDALVARLKGLAASERRATALLIAHLAEMDTRDVYLRVGYSSLFSYCCGVLALSEHEALNRIEAARAARRFPIILQLLEAGEINLTAVRLLGPHLTPGNHVAVLESARRKRKTEVEEIVAALSPRADVPASVRRLPEPKARPALVGLAEPSVPVVTTAAPASVAAERLAAVPNASPRRSAEVTPLSPARYRYQVTIGASTLEKLRFAKDILRHALPSGDDEAVRDRALTSRLSDLARTKFGREGRTRSSGTARGGLQGLHPGRPFPCETVPSRKDTGAGGPGAPDSRHIPASVKRAVWVRDLGRCAFVSADGHRCGERAFVEFHHVRPYATGGRPTVDNIQLRCRRHNGYEARVFFDRETIDAGLDGRAAQTSVEVHRGAMPEQREAGATSDGKYAGVRGPDSDTSIGEVVLERAPVGGMLARPDRGMLDLPQPRLAK